MTEFVASANGQRFSPLSGTHQRCRIESAGASPICLLHFFPYQFPVTGNQAMWLLSQYVKLETKASPHEGQCIPAGSSVSRQRMVLITVSIITVRSISRELCVRLFTLCKISTAILRILWRHLQTDL